MGALSGYEPAKVLHYFEEICRIPHGSGDTGRISEYCVKFCKDRGLPVEQDSLNNIIIKKEASRGRDDRETVIIQGHLDMVCEKTKESSHDFLNDGLDVYVDRGWIRARETTLGADDGIAVAMALALLDSEDICHPGLEVVLTVDEETGMLGAWGIDISGLRGKMLLNIDSEEEGILTVGCAGGFRCTATVPVTRKVSSGVSLTVEIKGLKGGHSGAEIHKQRGNAHKLMGRLLVHLETLVDYDLISVRGGGKDNVISMESVGVICVAEDDRERVFQAIGDLEKILQREYAPEEPDLEIVVTSGGEARDKALDEDSKRRVLNYMALCPNGVMTYYKELDNMVETSLNLGIVCSDEGSVTFTHLVRSSVESAKDYMKETMTRLGQSVGAKVEITGEYPGWQYNPHSRLRQVMMETYRELYGKEPVVEAIHAGLECGIFMGKNPELDCVSFGPTMADIHSFNERIEVASVERTWNYLKEVLNRI